MYIHLLHQASKFHPSGNPVDCPPAASKACASSEGLAARDPRASWRLSRLLPAMPQVVWRCLNQPSRAKTTHDHTISLSHRALPPSLCLSLSRYISPPLYYIYISHKLQQSKSSALWTLHLRHVPCLPSSSAWPIHWKLQPCVSDRYTAPGQGWPRLRIVANALTPMGCTLQTAWETLQTHLMSLPHESSID